MEDRAISFLETERIGTLMRRYSVPCVVSMLVAALYNIVDQIFIANALYLGSHGNAASTVVFPMTVAAVSIAVMIGDGCCAFVSISLGRNDSKLAGSAVGSAVVMSILSGLIMMSLYLIFKLPLLTLFGGRVNAETFKFANEYFFYIALGIPFYMFGQAMNPVIRSDGSPKFAMASILAGAITNIILDPIFIFVFRWGMTGAAVATVLGQIVTAALAVWHLSHMKAVRLSLADLRPHLKLAANYIPLGMCSFLSQISIVACMAAVQSMMLKYGSVHEIFGIEEYAQIPLAVLGIVMKFFQIVISVSVGLAAGCIPITGYNIGAGRRDRALELFTLLLKCEAAAGAVAFIIAEFFPHALISIFGAANESIHYTVFAVKCFRWYLSMIVFSCINKAAFIYLQSLGKALASTVLSLIREILFGVGFAVLLPMIFGLDGVILSMPVSELLTAIIAAYVIHKTYNELRRGRQSHA